MGTVSPVSQTDMKFLSFLLCVSLTAAAIVRREAEPGGYGAEPQCTVTPVKECKQRTVETPKKVCQTVVDKPAPVVVHHVSAPVVKTAPAQTSPPECTSTPVKTCKNTPVSTPRQVSRQVCETVVDITYVEDCTETITKSCASSSTSHSATSRVTGHDLQVIAGGSVSGKAVTGGSY